MSTLVCVCVCGDGGDASALCLCLVKSVSRVCVLVLQSDVVVSCEQLQSTFTCAQVFCPHDNIYMSSAPTVSQWIVSLSFTLIPSGLLLLLLLLVNLHLPADNNFMHPHRRS